MGKKNLLNLFTILLTITSSQIVQAYVVKNSEKSNTEITAYLFPAKEESIADRFVVGAKRGKHDLKPGEHASWNQKAIKAKTGVNELRLEVFALRKGPIINEIVPIGADLEIIVKKKGTIYQGGAKDINTGKIYGDYSVVKNQ